MDERMIVVAIGDAMFMVGAEDNDAVDLLRFLSSSDLRKVRSVPSYDGIKADTVTDDGPARVAIKLYRAEDIEGPERPKRARDRVLDALEEAGVTLVVKADDDEETEE